LRRGRRRNGFRASGSPRPHKTTRLREVICSVAAFHTRSILSIEREPHVRPQ